MQLNQGDYQLALAGSMHGEVVSPNGWLLLIRSQSQGRGPSHIPNSSLQGHHAHPA